MKKKPPKVSRCYLRYMNVADGLAFIGKISTRKEPTYLHGERLKCQSDKKRFAVLLSCPLVCFKCGCKATHFMIERHKNENYYHVNAYSGNKMLTWDHIIPRSLGGSDHIKNARIACEHCNVKRGNHMTIEELIWAARQDPNEVFKLDHETFKSIEGFKHSLRQAGCIVT